MTEIRKFVCCVLLCLLVTAQRGFSQGRHEENEELDSSYVTTFDGKLTPRLFFGNRIHSLRISSGRETNYFRYSPNTRWNIGAGVSYKAITLNLALNLFGQDTLKGKTSFIDLQTNIYMRHWTIDALVQSYKGFYIKEQGLVAGHNFYKNPDLRVTIIGGGAWRIFNAEQFSYRAAMTQDEWQKKSAGSVLAGWVAYYGNVNGGQLIPVGAPGTIPQNNVRGIHFFKTGPGISYAYTYVYNEHFFVSAGLSTTLELGVVKEFTDSAAYSKTNFAPNATFRIGAGYNSDKWNFNIGLFNSSASIKSSISPIAYRVTGGSFRITVARRFVPNSKTRQFLKRVDDTLGQ